MSGTKSLPKKILLTMANDIGVMMEKKNLSVAFIQKSDPAHYVIAGGIWDPVAATYEQIPFEQSRKVYLTDPQYASIVTALEALDNPGKMQRGEVPVSDIIFHGPRRGGKSFGLFAMCLFVALARPAARIWIVGLRLVNGERILTLMRRSILRGSYIWDKRNASLRLANNSIIVSRSATNFTTDRGEGLDLVCYDESAFMPEKVHEALSISVADCDGFSAHFSSPNIPNWFSRLAEKNNSPDPTVRELVRVIHCDPKTNTFKPNLAARLAHFQSILSLEAYQRECLGMFVSETGKALPTFSRDMVDKGGSVVMNWVDHWIRNGISDATDLVGKTILEMYKISTNNRTIRYLVGMDFNLNPTVGVIHKIDSEGRIWAVAEVATAHGTEEYGIQLEEQLKAMGCEDPHRESIIVADSSGEWQDMKNKWSASSKILRTMGYFVIRPTPGKVNPRRVARLEVARALCSNALGERRYFVDAECDKLIQTLNEIVLDKTGLPSKFNKGNHIYDATSYLQFRIWGTTLGYKVFGRQLVDSRILSHE